MSYRAFFQGDVVHFEERIFNRPDRPRDATIARVFDRLGDKKNVLLKMDIEGGEYRVIEDLMRHESRIDMMVIEFHNTEPYRDVFLKHIRSISRHFEITHVHGNNYGGLAHDGLPEVLEITFLHDRYFGSSAVQSRQRRNRLPLAGLDFPCNPRKQDYQFLFQRSAEA